MIDITSVLIGCGLGLFAGLMPGLGPFTTMLMVFPLFLDMSIIELLIVYTGLYTTSIYVGSVPATLYGIPGDSASMPVVYESRNLKSLRQVSQAISGAAFGGFFGSMAVALFCIAMLKYLDTLKYFYSTPLFLSLLLIASSVILWTAGNKKLISLLLYTAGFVLGLVGYNAHLDTAIFVLHDYMWRGLPNEIVMSMLFAVPMIAFYWNHFKTKAKNRSRESFSVWTVYMLNPATSLFYTVIGFFTGLVPGLTTILSSTLSYNIMGYFTKDPVKRIVASETGNNAGAFSMLLPLLLFGIPISSSEALLLFFLEQNGYSNINTDLALIMKTLVYNFFFINLVGLTLSWPLSKYVKYFYKLDLRYVFGSVLLMILCSLMYSGVNNSSVTYYLILILILAPIGVSLRKHDLLPLIFAFLISDKALSSMVILKQLYF